MGPKRGRRSGEQITDQAAYGGAGADFLRCELLSRAKGVIGLLVFAPLAERLRGRPCENSTAPQREGGVAAAVSKAAELGR